MTAPVSRKALTQDQGYRIQLLRALAIAAVVLGHCVPGGAASYWLRPFCNFSVGLFLFLSGLLSDAASWRPWKRIKKVLIPYVLWTLIYTAIPFARYPAALLRWFFRNLLTGDAAPVMYFVFVYVELTLLIPWIDRLARSKYRYLGLLITPLEVIGMKLLPNLLGLRLASWMLTVRTLSCLGWFGFFYLGYLLGNGLLTLRRGPGLPACLLLLAVPLEICEGWLMFSNGIADCGTTQKLTAILTAALACLLAWHFLQREKPVRAGLLKLLGDCSFGIFFAHPAVMRLLRTIPRFSTWAVFPLNAAAVLAVTLLLVLAGRRLLGRFAKYLAF